VIAADEPALGARAEAAGVHFGAWSDRASAMSVVLYATTERITREVPLSKHGDSGFFSAFVPGLPAGSLYGKRIV